MSHATCAHCGTKIVDHATMRAYQSETYCCQNCVAAVNGTIFETGLSRCAHCETQIIDKTSEVDGAEGRIFCCNNCAMAMAQGVTHKKS